jgi:exodeoxyribonuclease-3
MGKSWTIASFNVNSIRARLPVLVSWLEKARPEVVALQETKCQDQDFPEEEVRAAGYHAVFKGEKAYNGVALLSLAPAGEVSFGFGTEPDSDATRLLAAVIDGVTIVNTYVPQGRDPDSEHFQHKLKWFDRLLRFFADHFSPNQDLLWVGDLNGAPEDRDVYDPKRLLGHVDFHPQGERAERIHVGPILSDFHQPFGLFRGRLGPPGGAVEVKDLFGLCEQHITRN